MVKGTSRQVILVQSPEPKLFDQAIFILNEKALEQGVTDEMLMKEANRLIREGSREKGKQLSRCGPVWACGGALLTGAVWLLTALF